MTSKLSAVNPFSSQLYREPDYKIILNPGYMGVSTKTKKGTKLRRFEYIDQLIVKNPSGHIYNISFPNTTIIETTAKIDKLRGDTLIIVNSHNIGNIKAKKVILISSTLESIEADDIIMFESNIKGGKTINKKISFNTISSAGIESALSFVALEKSTVDLSLNEKGFWDIMVTNGAISTPKYTLDGQPYEIKMALDKAHEGKSEVMDESIGPISPEEPIGPSKVLYENKVET
ncbi:MAG: hypothetical protein H0X29_09675 [Parachlamydiaceae bacterium]|nr:hypothetical protein [Parachlamydiaceae bacterium]